MDDARRLRQVAPAENDRAINVVTAGDGLYRPVLEADHDIVVVASVEAAGQVRRAVARNWVDVVLLQMRPRAGELYEVARDLRRDHPATAIVVCDGPFDAAVLLDAVEAGVRGYGLEGMAPVQLRRIVRAVALGEVAIPRRLLGNMLELLTERRLARERALRRLWRLTARERLVLALLTEARSNAAISSMLHISPQTTRKHVQNVMSKLGVHSRLEAVTFVHRHALEDQLSA